MGKHSCQGHTAAIRHERASPKSNVSKTGKRQARICKGVLKVSFPGESEPWKNLDIEQFMIQCQHAVMERSIVAYLKACDWDRMRCDSLRILLPFFSLTVVRSGKTPFFTSLFTRDNSFEIPGFVEFSMKTLQECIT